MHTPFILLLDYHLMTCSGYKSKAGPAHTYMGVNLVELNGNPILWDWAPVGAVVAKHLPLQPMGAMAAIGGSLGKGNGCPFPPGKGTGPPKGLLTSVPTILPAIWPWRIGFGCEGHCCSHLVLPLSCPVLPSLCLSPTLKELIASAGETYCLFRILAYWTMLASSSSPSSPCSCLVPPLFRKQAT